MHDIGNAWDILLSLLDDAQSENGQIHADDASTNGFTLALTGTAGSVAGVALGEKEADTSWVHNTLLHWETLLVVASGDAEDVALELITNAVTWNFGTHSIHLLGSLQMSTYSGVVPLIHENTELSLILNVDELLAAIGRL